MPTHSEVTRFISSLLPPKTNDVPLLYHVPHNGGYNFDTAQCEQVVLSVTPTTGVYDALGDDTSKAGNSGSRQGSEEPRPPHTIAFIHRPFDLDRRRIRDNLLVLASHNSFDENLTVGWNPHLAARLGVQVSSDDFVPVLGYKSDPERRIGAIAKVCMILGPLLHSIEKEFGAIECAQEGLSEEVHVLAMMNAFGPDEVNRVLEMAVERGWVQSEKQLGRHVVYLTGQARKGGLEEARRRGLTVVCVGHRVAEQWGIGFMAGALRREWEGLKVREVYEDELVGNGHA